MRRPRLAILASVTLLAACSSQGGDDGGARPSEEPATESRTAETQTTASTPDRRRRPQGKLRLRLVEVVSGLASPVHVAATAGEPDRLYVVEQAGRIRVVENGRLRREAFLDIRELVESGGEQGLLSVAFHPRYASNRRFYVDYTDTNGDTRMVEYRADRAGRRALEESARVLLAVDQPYANHNGGQLAFGPDRRLYVGMGDGGGGGDPENRAQDLGSLLGKLVRLDVDQATPEAEIAAYGLRNPWRFSFDRANGDLYLGDVGEQEWEEIDYVSEFGRELENFGWDVFEGNETFEDKEPNPQGRIVPPLAVYSHDDGCSVTGGFVYRGSRMPLLRGRYFYGDYCSGTVWSLRVRDGKPAGLRREPFEVASLSSFGEDAHGELYLVSHTGSIFRLSSL